MSDRSLKPKKCIICPTKLYSWDECAEIWVEGHRIWICKDPECRKVYAKAMRDETIDKRKLIST